MRQVFSSPRLENVEAVARLLEAEGIEVRISNGRSYKGGLRGNFSYRDHAPTGTPRPAVWIIRSEDQPRARQLLRDAGLLKTSARADDNFLLPAVQPRADDDAPHWRKGARFRYGLLLLIATLVALVFAASRHMGGGDAGTIATPPPAAAPARVDEPPPTFVIATPPALAATLFASELASSAAQTACLSIDDADPPPAVLAGLEGAAGDVRGASACDGSDGDALYLGVAGYRTDGSGIGTVELRRRLGDADVRRRLEVQRTGDTWRVLGEP